MPLTTGGIADSEPSTLPAGGTGLENYLQEMLYELLYVKYAKGGLKASKLFQLPY